MEEGVDSPPTSKKSLRRSDDCQNASGFGGGGSKNVTFFILNQTVKYFILNMRKILFLSFVWCCFTSLRTMIHFKIITLDGKDYPIDIDEESSIKDLREHMQERTGIASTQQRFIFQGRALVDNDKLKDLNLEGKVVHMVPRPPPRSTPSVSSNFNTQNTSENQTPNRPRVSTNMFVINSMEDVTRQIDTNLEITQSPTCARLREIKALLIEIRQDLENLATTSAMPGHEATGREEGLPRSSREAREGEQQVSQQVFRVRDFAEVILEVQELSRTFSPYIPMYARLLQEIVDGVPSEENMVVRQQIAYCMGRLFHSFGHANHIISDIHVLLSNRETRIVSEVIAPHSTPLRAQISAAGVALAGADGAIRRPTDRNVGGSDPITVQLQIETRLPIGVGVLDVPQRGQVNPPDRNTNANETAPDRPVRDINIDDGEPVFEIPIRIEGVPLEHGLQNLLPGRQNAAGTEHNVFVAQVPDAAQPSPELIQQLLSLFATHGILPSDTPASNPRVIIPNADAGAEAPSATASDPLQNRSEPDRTSQRTVAGGRVLQGVPITTNVRPDVYDPTLACDSVHARDEVQRRNPERDGLVLTDVAWQRMQYNLETLYVRFRRDTSVPGAALISCHILLRERLTPAPLRIFGDYHLSHLRRVVTASLLGLIGRDALVDSDECCDTLTEAIMAEHGDFFDRSLQAMRVRPEVDVVASLSALVRSRLRDFIRAAPGAQTVDASLLRVYRGFCDLIGYFAEGSVQTFQEIYRAFFIHCAYSLDETTLDLLFGVAMSNMAFGMNFISRSPRKGLRTPFVVERVPENAEKPQETTVSDEAAHSSASCSWYSALGSSVAPDGGDFCSSRRRPVLVPRKASRKKSSRASEPSSSDAAPTYNDNATHSPGPSTSASAQVPASPANADLGSSRASATSTAPVGPAPCSPFSDAYVSGMPHKKRLCVRQARPPTALQSFIEETLNDVEVNAEPQASLQQMFQEWFRVAIRQRRLRCPDFDEGRLKAVTALTEEETESTESQVEDTE
ncbi:unnamed protein product [Leptosia nina]|uniref:BCL2-associated athanogene 6 n=1 Tax=Leptosia nina TaxID=320188 RepID=A0AAV1K3L3_9NEOP